MGGEVKKIEKLDRYSATSDQLIQPAAATETLVCIEEGEREREYMYVCACY